MVFHDFLLHIFIVHAPDAVLNHQGAVDNVVAIVPQGVGKAHIGGAVDKHIVAPGAHDIQGRHHAAQHAVGIEDVLRCHSLHAVVPPVPGYDTFEVFLPGGKIAIGRMGSPGDDGLGDCGHRGEVHVRDPHGDQVIVLARLPGRMLHGDGIQPTPVHNGCKIVAHTGGSFFFFFSHYTSSRRNKQEELEKEAIRLPQKGTNRPGIRLRDGLFLGASAAELPVVTYRLRNDSAAGRRWAACRTGFQSCGRSLSSWPFLLFSPPHTPAPPSAAADGRPRSSFAGSAAA